MAFSDPQSVNPGGGAVSLPRVNVGANSSTYRSADSTLEFSLSHLYTRRDRIRRTARVDLDKMSADPFIPAQNRLVSASAYVVIDLPSVGFSNTELLNLYKGLEGNLAASTYANMAKLLGGES